MDEQIKKVKALQQEYNRLIKRIDEILVEQSKLMAAYYGYGR
jgi:hypothetical protein